MGLFDELDQVSTEKSKDTIVRAPFGWPGGKSRSIFKILTHLPYRNTYVEPFGGSAAVLLAREPSNLEIYNDRYSGVVAFYTCLRDPKLFNALVDRLELSLHAREDFVVFKETWDNVNDPVERAARWYSMLQMSFGGLSRNWGRSTSGKQAIAGKIRGKLDMFPRVHERMKRVQVENQDWYHCMMDYDSPDTVFYLDPPYVDADPGIYKHGMSHKDHRHLLDTIFKMKGFVAVSGYPNPLYDNQNWDDAYEWESFVSIKSMAYAESNFKEHLRGREQRDNATECLWIKHGH